jgi:4-hydroxybenzoate polyprenyltransferase
LLVTPGVRVATVPACGLAQLPYRTFLPGLVVGSGLFLGLHFAIGYLGGPLIGASSNSANLPLVTIFAALLVLGLAGWMVMRRRTRIRKEGAVTVTLERLNDWSDASCPVCLAIGAVDYLRHREAAPAEEHPVKHSAAQSAVSRRETSLKS